MRPFTVATLLCAVSLAHAKLDQHVRAERQSSLYEVFRRHSLPDDDSLGIDVDVDLPPAPKPKSSEKVHLKHVTTAQIIARQASKGRRLSARASSVPPTNPITVVLKASGAKQVDDQVWTLDELSFKMEVFGKKWSANEITISSNGWIRFGSGTSDAWSNHQDLPAKSVGKNVLFPYWSDLQILKPYSLTYTYNNKGVTFDWQTVHYGESKSNLVHFQVKYSVDSPNIVKFLYVSDSDSASLLPKDATIGLQSSSSSAAYTKNKKIVPGASLTVTTQPVSISLD